MHKVIFDCDNTMGVEGKDVDDGLALLYLLGRDDVDILGVTATYGNSTIDVVYENTLNMFNELNINHIPLYKGAPSRDNRQSPAAVFLADMAKKYPGEITLLATGSLTNLLGAYEICPDFFNNIKKIVLMGGITKPLIINGKNLDELNFSCDPWASFKVLSCGCDVTVLTGHICLQAYFGPDEFKRLSSSTCDIYSYINKKSSNWMRFIMQEFGIDGFYNWDIVAAVYITNPELFKDNTENIISTAEDLKKGYLKTDPGEAEGFKVTIPKKILNVSEFNNIIFKAWENV